MDWRKQADERLKLESPPLISEHQFATHYSSVWRLVAPLSDGFWTFENRRVERVDPPLWPIAPKEMRAIINDASFRAFCVLHSQLRPILKDQIVAAIKAELQNAIDYIARFSNAPSFVLSDIDADCQEEAQSLVSRLLGYFPYAPQTVLRPRFSGCGLISECEGDLIEGDCLYEIKAGDRAFRVLDLRQLLTYSALAYARGSMSFSRIGLFNPRTGVAWTRSLDEVCQAISGHKANDTLSNLVEHFSMASASR